MESGALKDGEPEDPLQFDHLSTTLRLQRISFDDYSSPDADW